MSTDTYSGRPVVTRAQAGAAAASVGLSFPRWYTNGTQFKPHADARSTFFIPTLAECESLGLGYGAPGKRGRKPGTVVVRQSKPRVPKVNASVHLAQPAKVDVATLVRDDQANTDIQIAVSKALGVDVLLGSADNIPYVPQVAKTFVPWGHFTDLKTLVESQHFLPTMIVGPSGNGKTDMCEQVCANLGREYVRVNITSQTDEDDLLGGFRLVGGETKFALGPIPLAMLRGAVVNLDEIDLGGSALMCLQPVLEGKPLYLKKIGRYINPAPGFNVVATANTKGRGDDGKYAHTTIMNEAMLERFAVMLEQGWADAATERKIVGNVLKQYGKYDATLVKHLVEFANVTRNNFEQQICNDQIATRRLLHTARVFCALGSIESALTHTLSRFDADTANGFKNLWNAIHENPNAVTSPSGEAVQVEPTPAV
ncbi:MAG: AAA family ATPase [Ilumatobacteraceae bacterium]